MRRRGRSSRKRGGGRRIRTYKMQRGGGKTMKKWLISLAANAVLDVLLRYAVQQYDNGGGSAVHNQRWRTIIDFIREMKEKGLPL